MLQFLGTGGAFTDFRVNYHNNALVQTDAGPVLIDCGGTAVQSLKETGVHPGDVAGLIVTHMHGDHVGGIEQLIWERFYTGPSGPAFKQTPIYTTPGLQEAVARFLLDCIDEFTDRDGVSKSGGYNALVARHDVRSLSWVEIGGVEFRLHRTPHVVGPTVHKMTLGVELRRNDQSAYYTSDTVFRPDIGARFPNVGVIFHDCTFTPYYPSTVHTHYSQLLTLPPDVRARIVLMHHTRVPDGVDVVADGFRAAASRHDRFDIFGS